MKPSNINFKRLFLYFCWAIVGTIGGMIIAFAIQGSILVDLEPWHTVELTEEFTVHKTDSIRTFDDYLKLEERLFKELQSKVYTRTVTGSEYALARYSAGSSADPHNNRPNWNRSFELASATPKGGVLLLHGMSDSPYSLRALGETLNQQGYWVLGLRLPGHGTTPSSLKSIHWRDMAAAIQLGVEHLNAKAGKKPIHLIGYSTGAPLALDFTLNALNGEVSPVPTSLVLISPAIGVSPAAALAKWKKRLSILPGLGGFAWMSVEPEFDPYKYNSFATNISDQVHRLTKSVSDRIVNLSRSKNKIEFPPILVFKSTVDATVSSNAVVDRLLGLLPPHRHELVLFDINRFAAKSTLLVAEPGPMTTKLKNDDNLPFTFTLVTNENPESATVVARRKLPFSSEESFPVSLNMAWPREVISLSHIALPIPPDDPLYGHRPSDNKDLLFLGQMAIRGERGLLKLPSDWLMRLRHNPFYSFLENRTLNWVDAATEKVMN